MYTIENEQLAVQVKPQGAELCSIRSKLTGTEYLWNGDPAFWAKHSPILFPIVGTLKGNTFYYKNKPYKLSRHGFARDKVFKPVLNAADSVAYVLESDESTLSVYPFHFRLEIGYTVSGDRLETGYTVTNTGEDDMYFSIGGHPAFRLPLENDLRYEDYVLEFSENENAGRWMISADGLIEPTEVPLMENTDMLPVSRDLFKKDAVVLKNLQSDRVQLKSGRGKHGLEFFFHSFPFLGIWAAPGADFLCIEPWCGIADSTNADQQLVNKEGIEVLAPGSTFRRKWSVRFF